MKTRILLTTFTIAIAASATPDTAHTSMMCQHDWLAVWRNAASLAEATTANSPTTFTGGSRVGSWAISSTTGGAGRQSINGISVCDAAPAPSPSSGTEGPNCWCRMMSPMIGSWVLIQSSEWIGAGCTQSCASFCALRVRDNATLRASILAIH